MRLPRALLAAVALAPGLLAGAAGAIEPPPPLPAYVPPPSVLPPPQDPITFDFGPHAGVGYRVGPSNALPIQSRWGGVIGASAMISPSRLWSAGLAYEHSRLGSEHGMGDAGDVDANRSL